MKNFVQKYRDWKYARSAKFQNALNAANKELERQQKWKEYKKNKE